MTAVLCLVFIALLGLGTMNDLKANLMKEKNPKLVPNYNLLVVLGAGLAAIVAMIALIAGSFTTAIIALVLTVLFPITYLVKAAKLVAMINKSGGRYKAPLQIQPYWVWGRIVLLGMGKWTHIVLCVTLIGIPLYNIMKTMNANLDVVQEQDRLRREYELIKEFEAHNENQ